MRQPSKIQTFLGHRFSITIHHLYKACLLGILFSSTILGQARFRWDWHHSEELTFKDSLLRVGIKGSVRMAIARTIADELRPEMSDLGIESEEQLEKVALDTRVKFIDLDEDGTPEVIAQGMGQGAGCGATGNCPFWILRKTRNRYRILTNQATAQTFTIERNPTDGFKDIVVTEHQSAAESTVTLLRFGRGAYHTAACYEAYWWTWVGGELRKLKEPRLVPCGVTNP